MPYFKASGKCLRCPAEDDLVTPLQMTLMALFLVGAGSAIWLSAAAPAEAEANASVDESMADGREQAQQPRPQDTDQVTMEVAGPISESAVILLPTFQFFATAFSCDFSWSVFQAFFPLSVATRPADFVHFL